MRVYITWATNTVMSSRVYLNLVLAAHGGEMDGVTTGRVSSFRVNHPDGTDREPGQIVMFGGERVHRRAPLTIFAMVSLDLFSSPPLYLLQSLTATLSFQSVLSSGSNTPPDLKPYSQREDAVVTDEALTPDGEEH